MDDQFQENKIVRLSINNENDLESIEKICYSLSSKERLQIMKSLINSSKCLSDIAIELRLPISTVSRHIDALQNAGLITVNYKPSPKGHIKMYSQKALKIHFNLEENDEFSKDNKEEYSMELPVGLFTELSGIKAPCGLCGIDSKIIEYDNPELLYNPERAKAERIWIGEGFVTYTFPKHLINHHKCHSIEFSFEICSETYFYSIDWPSDITMFINDKEVLTITTPGDFGGRRGNFTSANWSVKYTQYGLLKKVTVDETGVYLDNALVTKDLTFDDLKLYDNDSIKLKLGIKADAIHKGGLNIFGKNYGDFNQAIIMKVK